MHIEQNLAPRAIATDSQYRAIVWQSSAGPSRAGDYLLRLTDNLEESKSLAAAWVAAHPGTMLVGFLPQERSIVAPIP